MLNFDLLLKNGCKISISCFIIRFLLLLDLKLNGDEYDYQTEEDLIDIEWLMILARTQWLSSGAKNHQEPKKLRCPLHQQHYWEDTLVMLRKHINDI